MFLKSFLSTASHFPCLLVKDRFLYQKNKKQKTKIDFFHKLSFLNCLEFDVYYWFVVKEWLVINGGVAVNKCSETVLTSDRSVLWRVQGSFFNCKPNIFLRSINPTRSAFMLFWWHHQSLGHQIIPWGSVCSHICYFNILLILCFFLFYFVPCFLVFFFLIYYKSCRYGV